MKLLGKLKQPYPTREKSLKSNLISIILTSSFVAGFLILFEPFGISAWHNKSKIWLLLGFGAVTFWVLFFFKVVLVKVFKSFFKEENWTVLKEILVSLVFLTTLAMANYAYASISSPVLKWAFTSFIWSFFTVITVGIFPIVFSIIYNYNKQLRKYGMEIAVNKLESENETLHTLLADNQKDKLVLKGKDLLYIESADNYAHVFHLKEAELRNDLLRGSLSRMEEFLNDEDIARCHRSFIVNLSLVDRVSGNAQGYKLHLRDIDKLIPVARKYSHLIERFK